MGEADRYWAGVECPEHEQSKKSKKSEQAGKCPSKSGRERCPGTGGARDEGRERSWTPGDEVDDDAIFRQCNTDPPLTHTRRRHIRDQHIIHRLQIPKAALMLQRRHTHTHTRVVSLRTRLRRVPTPASVASVNDPIIRIHLLKLPRIILRHRLPRSLPRRRAPRPLQRDHFRALPPPLRLSLVRI